MKNVTLFGNIMVCLVQPMGEARYFNRGSRIKLLNAGHGVACFWPTASGNL